MEDSCVCKSESCAIWVASNNKTRRIRIHLIQSLWPQHLFSWSVKCSICQTWHFFINQPPKLPIYNGSKNRIFQYCLFLNPTSSTMILSIRASWHVLNQKMYLKKIETLDFVDNFFFLKIILSPCFINIFEGDKTPIII